VFNPSVAEALSYFLISCSDISFGRDSYKNAKDLSQQKIIKNSRHGVFASDTLYRITWKPHKSSPKRKTLLSPIAGGVPPGEHEKILSTLESKARARQKLCRRCSMKLLLQGERNWPKVSTLPAQLALSKLSGQEDLGSISKIACESTHRMMEQWKWKMLCGQSSNFL